MQDLLLNKTKKDNEANLYFEQGKISWTLCNLENKIIDLSLMIKPITESNKSRNYSTNR